MADVSLTWEVPPGLDRNWGPALADLPLPPAQSAVGAAAGAADASPGSSAAAGASSNAAAAAAAAASAGSLDIGALPVQGAPSSGLHPLVLLNRQEFGATAEQHLRLVMKQLLAAEDVQQQEVRTGQCLSWRCSSVVAGCMSGLNSSGWNTQCN